MSALYGVLADLVEADRECAYVTVKREPLETLIDEWARRGDQISLFSSLLPCVRQEFAHLHAAMLDPPSRLAALCALDEAIEESASAIARHRHALRREFAAQLKQMLRSAIADVGAHVTDALLAGNSELADRLESERQTVRIIMSTIDAVVDRLLQDELTAAASRQDGHSMPHDLSVAANQPTHPSGEHACLESLLATINAGHDLFQNRHNWLLPLTTDEERRQFIAAACNWWNNVVCPSMDRIGARWNEQSQRFELPLTAE